MKLAHKGIFARSYRTVFSTLCSNAQVSSPLRSANVGQAKADLIKSAFSSYLSGDTNQSRQYLMRASELDVEDVTVRRLLETLTRPLQPVAVASSPPAPVTAASFIPSSASDQLLVSLP